MSGDGKGYLSIGAMFVATIILGLGLVWVNIERVDLAYELKTLERELQEKQDQNSKLQVERHYLLAPATLRARAEKAGLRPPGRDQIRILQD
jgi:cell division protein FtsL